jgi:cell division protein FtsW (lipid II flippase)
VQIDRRLISHFDWTLFLLTVTFFVIGVVTIYSANYDITADHAGTLPSRQFFWFGIGMSAMLVALAFDYHYTEKLAYPFYGAILLLLVLVLFVGHSGGGSQRWINLGFFRLQPSEPAKLASPAAFFADPGSTGSRHRHHSWAGVYQHGHYGWIAHALFSVSGGSRTRVSAARVAVFKALPASTNLDFSRS